MSMSHNTLYCRISIDISYIIRVSKETPHLARIVSLGDEVEN